MTLQEVFSTQIYGHTEKGCTSDSNVTEIICLLLSSRAGTLLSPNVSGCLNLLRGGNSFKTFSAWCALWLCFWVVIQVGQRIAPLLSRASGLTLWSSRNVIGTRQVLSQPKWLTESPRALLQESRRGRPSAVIILTDAVSPVKKHTWEVSRKWASCSRFPLQRLRRIPDYPRTAFSFPSAVRDFVQALVCILIPWGGSLKLISVTLFIWKIWAIPPNLLTFRSKQNVHIITTKSHTIFLMLYINTSLHLVP